MPARRAGLAHGRLFARSETATEAAIPRTSALAKIAAEKKTPEDSAEPMTPEEGQTLMQTGPAKMTAGGDAAEPFTIGEVRRGLESVKQVSSKANDDISQR